MNYTDLNRFDTEVLCGIVLEHEREMLRRPPDEWEWFETDIARIRREISRRMGAAA